MGNEVPGANHAGLFFALESQYFYSSPYGTDITCDEFGGQPFTLYSFPASVWLAYPEKV